MLQIPNENSISPGGVVNFPRNPQRYQENNSLIQLKLEAFKDAENSANIWLSKNETCHTLAVERVTIIMNDLYKYYFEFYKQIFGYQEVKN